MISVIVPMHNVGKYIEECLVSLMQQSSQDFEAIIVNDGCTDGTAEVAQRYCQQQTNFFYYERPYEGVSEARNFGISQASGEYLMFLDGDDYFAKDCIEQYDKILTDSFTGIDVLVGNLYTIDESQTIFRDRPLSTEVKSGFDYYKQQLQEDNFKSPVWIHAFRREFIQENAICFTRDIYHEDEEYVVKAYLAAKSVADSGIKHYYYRRFRVGSIMTDDKKLDKRITDAKQVYFSLCPVVEATKDQELVGLFNRYWLRFFLQYILEEHKKKSKAELKTPQIDQSFIAKFDISKTGDKKMQLRQRLFQLNPHLYLQVMKFRGYQT